MIRIEKILCPVDFSDCSEKAVTYAVALAERFAAQLHLLHVLDMRIYSHLEPLAGSGWSVHDIEGDVVDDLEELVRPEDRGAIDVDTVVRKGNPFVEIVTFAKDEGIDLIVIGTHGRTGLKHMLIGSVAERVVRRAPCPVLTIRPDERDFVTP